MVLNKNGACIKEKDIFVINDFQQDRECACGFKGTYMKYSPKTFKGLTFHTKIVHQEYLNKK